MKCLSLRQPYADLVVSGRKTIELRTWNTKFRGLFFVHASGNVDKEACRSFGIDPETVARKAIVGSAVLYGVIRYESTQELLKDSDRHLATGKYLNSMYGFLLKEAKRLEQPISIPGRLGFFNVDLGPGQQPL